MKAARSRQIRIRGGLPEAGMQFPFPISPEDGDRRENRFHA